VRILVRVSRAVAAAAVVVLAAVAGGCGNGGGRSSATAAATTQRASAPCRLSSAQRRSVARALADIRRLRRIEAPMQTYSQRGTPRQLLLTGKVEVDLGSTHLPPDVFSHLLHLAKAATRLCGDCGTALEAEEPVLGNRSESTQGPCG
jgi:hypothetical protein